MEKVRREKMQVREKVGKSRNRVFSQCIMAREGRKVGCGAKWPDERRKIARCCGAKHILKSRVAKHVGPLLEVEMSKKCTLLWCEAHLEVNMLKLPYVRATFGPPDVVQMSKKCTAL